MSDLAHDDWVAQARAVPILDAAVQMGARLKRVGHEHVGPCPSCGGRDRFAVHPAKGVWNCGHEGGAGGDAIALVQHVEGCTFATAVEILTGRPSPRGEAETDAQRAARRAHAAARAKRAADEMRERERASAWYRERERIRAHAIWRAGRPIAGTLAETYLARRGIRAPDGARLRFASDLGYFAPAVSGGPAREIGRGPAMLAAITDADGIFAGLHTTYLRSDGAKAEPVDPEKGEILPAKKVRGSAGGNRIELLRCPAPRRLVLAEGIETALTGWLAMNELHPDRLEGAAVWAAISLGNLAGRAVRSVPHPILRRTNKHGQDAGPLRIGGPEPDLASSAIRVPDSVEELLLIADGDSEPVMTGYAMERAARRHILRGDERPRTVCIATPPPGLDLNDVLLGKAA